MQAITNVKAKLKADPFNENATLQAELLGEYEQTRRSWTRCFGQAQ